MKRKRRSWIRRIFKEEPKKEKKREREEGEGWEQRGRGRRERQRREELKNDVWNTAGIKRKEREFWDYIKEFDIIGMSETWMEKKDWEKMKGNLSEMFNWKC